VIDLGFYSAVKTGTGISILGTSKLGWSWSQSLVSRLAGELNHKASGRVPLIFSLSAVTISATEHHCLFPSTMLYCWVTLARVWTTCPKSFHGSMEVEWLGVYSQLLSCKLDI